MKKLVTKLTLLSLLTATLGWAMDDAEAQKKIAARKEEFTCIHCNKHFEHKSKLLIHLRMHSQERAFACSHCPKTFVHKASCLRHVKTHTGKQYKCRYCPRRLADSNSLKRHIRTHTQERPYSCPTCSRQFADKRNLDTHIRIHTGDKPYDCPYCTKAFGDKSVYNRHVKKHKFKRDKLLSVDMQSSPSERQEPSGIPASLMPAEVAYTPLASEAPLPFATELALALTREEHKN